MSRPTRADPAGRAYLDLQNLARRQRRPTQALLVLYVVERFLARLATGPYTDHFVLKGGMLLAVWDARRATADAALLAHGLTLDPDQVLATVAAPMKILKAWWSAPTTKASSCTRTPTGRW